MNIFSEGIDGEFAVSADDGDMLLRMVEEAHRPFIQRPFVGDIAQDWQRRWQAAQPRPPAESRVAAQHAPTLEVAVQMLRGAYSGTGKLIDGPPRKPFPIERAVAAILMRWPGIAMDRPERDWNSRPEIAELHRMRSELQQRRELPASASLHSGGNLGATWR